MDDIAELVDNLNEIIKIQGNMIEKLTIKLLEYMEIEDIDRMMLDIVECTSSILLLCYRITNQSS